VRLVATALALAISAGTAVAGAAVRDTLQLTISHARFSPDPEDPHHAKGVKEWDTWITVKAHGPAPCSPVRIATWLGELHNRRPVGKTKHDVQSVNPRTSAIRVGVGGWPGEIFILTARASCPPHIAVSKQIRTRVQVPLFSCDEGPWLALRTQGRSWVANERRFLRLANGDVLYETDSLRTAGRGTLVFGAPRCHGLRFTLFPRSTGDVGAYVARRRSGSADLGHGSMRARNGGIGTGYLSIQPQGNRVALYDVISKLPSRVVIKVAHGTVLVRRAVSRTRQRLGIVRTGETGLVRCKSPLHCSAVKIVG